MEKQLLTEFLAGEKSVYDHFERSILVNILVEKLRKIYDDETEMRTDLMIEIYQVP